MRQLIDIFNTGDLRHLLIEYDESVAFEKLIPFFDNIMAEHDELSGSDGYASHIQKVEQKLYKDLKIKVYILMLMLFNYRMYDEINELNEEFNLKLNTSDVKNLPKKIDAKIKQIQTTLKIQEIQEKENEIKTKIKWTDLIVWIHQVLNISIHYDCSVELYLSYKNAADNLIKQKKQK